MNLMINRYFIPARAALEFNGILWVIFGPMWIKVNYEVIDVKSGVPGRNGESEAAVLKHARFI